MSVSRLLRRPAIILYKMGNPLQEGLVVIALHEGAACRKWLALPVRGVLRVIPTNGPSPNC